MIKQKEKERLWNEVMNSKRAYEKDLDSKDVLLEAEEARNSLNALLQKNSNSINAQLKDLSKQISEEFGIVEEKNDVEAKVLFQEIEEKVDNQVVGQSEAIHRLALAFYRPYLTNSLDKNPKNTILVHGPSGVGKHQSITSMVEQMHERDYSL